ncbi:hypothetical protein SLE2022_143560 [Rubroshorea leprosula]
MLVDAADIDGDGTLSCEEFVIMSVHLKRIDNNEHLFDAFNFFYKNRTGYIEFDELKEALLDDNLGSNTHEAIEDIMYDIALDKVILIGHLVINYIKEFERRTF